jgi:hypothetical protein
MYHIVCNIIVMKVGSEGEGDDDVYESAHHSPG